MTELSLAKFFQNEAIARSWIASRLRDVPLTFASKTWQFSLTAADLAAAEYSLCSTEEHRCFFLDWSGARCCLVIAPNIVENLCLLQLPSLALNALPAAFDEAVVQLAFGAFLNQLGDLGRGEVRFIPPLVQEEDQQRLKHRFELKLVAQEGGAQLVAYLALDTLGLMLLGGLAQHCPPVENTLSSEALSVCFEALLGETVFALADLQAIKAGDVLFFDACFWDEQENLYLRAEGGWGLKVSQKEGEWVVIDTLKKMASAEDAEASEAPKEPLSCLEDLPLTLTFDIGRLTLPVSRLKTLQAGEVLDLDLPLTHLVKMRVQGQLVGEGELVEVEGRMGVAVQKVVDSGGI